jgi:hypothetical protein
LAFKTSLWQDASNVTARFPVLGTGTGTFATAFNHFKSFAGDRTFLHAENEWIQLFVEHGLFGALLLLIPVGCFLYATWTFVRHDTPFEPELAFGTVAALACFLFNSLFDFVFQNSRQCHLGRGAGRFPNRDARPKRADPWWCLRPLCDPRLHVAGTLALVALVAVQSVAAFHAHQAVRTSNPQARLDHWKNSLLWWPWDSERAIALARQEVQGLAPLAANPGKIFRLERHAFAAN